MLKRPKTTKTQRARRAAEPAMQMQTLHNLGLEWAPIETLELDGGAVDWLRVTPEADEVRMPAAVEALRIEETGSVPKLKVLNPEDAFVLLAGNVVVIGGWQTRAIERS